MAISATVVIGGESPPPDPGGADPLDPTLITRWENVLISGAQNHENTGYTYDQTNPWYYDHAWVCQRARDYFGQSSPWQSRANTIGAVYKNRMDQSGGNRPGGKDLFPHGIYQDLIEGAGVYQESDLTRLVTPYQQWWDGAYFNSTNRYQYRGGTALMQREVTYAIQCQIFYEKLGNARLVDRDDEGVSTTTLEWFIRFTASAMQECRDQVYWTDANFPGLTYPSTCKPFYLGITAHAMIDFYEYEVANGRDPDAYWPATNNLTGAAIPWSGILECLDEFWTWLYEDAYSRNGPKMLQLLSGDRASFIYDDLGTSNGTERDLDLLCMPVYGWLYKKTGDMAHVNRGDKLFKTGVDWVEGRQPALGTPGNQKQFTQNFRWSFDYITWRNS